MKPQNTDKAQDRKRKAKDRAQRAQEGNTATTTQKGRYRRRDMRVQDEAS
ncbi:hypothetical protein AB3X91_16190 [Paraburkholderia sp. BR14263]